MENINLPPELSAYVSSENKDFAIKAGRAEPLVKSLIIIGSALMWVAFTSVLFFSFLFPVFQGKEVHFQSNGVNTVASPDNLKPLIMPAIVMSIFFLVGVALLIWGFYSFFKKGPYFVGTQNRLVSFQDGNVRSIDWEQFSGDINVKGDNNKADIYLQMRTGRMVSRKNGPDRYVPDVIYIAEISKAFEIERLCRKRIKENDPTPAITE